MYIYSYSDHCLFYSTDQLMKEWQKEDKSKTVSDTDGGAEPQSKQSNTQPAAEDQPDASGIGELVLVCVFIVCYVV